MCELLLDTDVLMKLAAYGLLQAIAHPFCPPACDRQAGTVAAARFVARKHLPRKSANAPDAMERLEAFLADAVSLEPTEDELALAAEFEEAATEAGLALDVGESQLCAIATRRARPLVLTGDKRAIIAAERLLQRGFMTALAQRLACLEQAIGLAVQRLGALTVRALVIAERDIDITISICFQATNPVVPPDFAPEGLESYLGALRAEAPTVLLPGAVLRTT
jgi:hypothetical protein